MVRLSLAATAAFALLAASCATVPGPGASGPEAGGPSAAPIAGDLELGDWRRASVGDTLRSFERSVAVRYPAGMTLAQANGDLRSKDFRCEPPRGGRGDPPTEVCTRSEDAGDCTHTWQVHLYKGDGEALARSRALYDRRCGDEGLLGGPG